ncbi:MAG: peptidoglycan-binding protein [Clostridia bacterium]|nr:peptidoglycan-binding protein [Clostridia bacterium]
MAKRMPIGRFVEELVAALNRGDGYIMGSYGQNPRTGYLDLSVPESKCKASWKENGYYYTQYSGGQRTSALKWRKKCTRVWDCNGMAEGIYELHTGVCINSKARHNYGEWCSVRGSGMIPAKHRVPGAAVFWSNSSAGSIHHVAYLWKPVKEGHPEGDWWIIEAKGVAYGVVKSKLYSRKPNFWGLMDKYFDYEATQSTPMPAGLSRGDEGSAVIQMQRALLIWNANCLPKWGADGDFGEETEDALKAYQKLAGLPVTGVYDDATREALTSIGKSKQVVITGGSLNVRSAPGTASSRVLGVAHKGDKLPYQGAAQAVEGRDWYLVVYKGENAWVSSKYSRIEG